MKESDHYRDNAENCMHLAERASDDATMKRYQRMADAWTALAREQDWLDGEKALEEIKLEAARAGSITG